MKLEVVLSDIGPFAGKHRFVLNSDKINVVEAPNASGKSSFIKGLAASLGLPSKSRMSHEVAKRLGLLPSTPDGRNPLVNILASQGAIELVSNEYSRALTAPAHGLPRVNPAGDDRFLITGLLLRESEIVRSLDEGSDDFSWLVSSLSLSSAYENAKRIVEEHQMEARDNVEAIRERQQSVSKLVPKIDEAERRREAKRKERKSLESKLKEVLKPDPSIEKEMERLAKKRDDKEQSIKELRTRIGQADVARSQAERELHSFEGDISRLESSLEQLQSKLKRLPSRQEIDEAQKEARELRRTAIPDLRQEYGRLEYDVKLLEQAEKGIHDSGTVPCPLCTRVKAKPIGSIPRTNFEAALEDARDKYRNLQAELARKIQKAEELEGLGLDAERRSEKLKEEQKRVVAELGMKKAHVTQARPTLDNTLKILNTDQSALEKEMAELSEAESGLKKLRQQYGGDKRQQVAMQFSRIEADLREIDGEISRFEKELAGNKTVEVKGRMMETEEALSVFQNWFDILTKVILGIDEAILHQRQGAAKAFNDHAMRLVGRMEFGGLQVWIDEHTYKLRVQRRSGDKLVDQLVSSLSTSERHALASVLTLAAKEAYAPEIPFFLVDEVILDFDSRRLNAFLSYLRESALSKGHFVVISRLGEGAFRVYPQEES